MQRTKTPQETSAQAITRLHNELYSLFDKGLHKAIQIGELLIQQKRALNHGEWIPWIQENLPFSDQTARNYIRLYLNQNELKSKNVLDLTTAYKALQQPKALNSEEKQRTLEKMKEAEILQKAEEIRQRRTEEMQNQLVDINQFIETHLQSDCYEWTPAGLKVKRQTTKEEWLKYGEHLTTLNELIQHNEQIPKIE